jgi:hypothetical protein
VVPFVDDFLRPGAVRADPLGSGEPLERCTLATRDDNICCSSREMERARAATHRAVALRRAATAGDNSVRELAKASGKVQGGMLSQSPLPLNFTTLHASRLAQKPGRRSLAPTPLRVEGVVTPERVHHVGLARAGSDGGQVASRMSRTRDDATALVGAGVDDQR